MPETDAYPLTDAQRAVAEKYLHLCDREADRVARKYGETIDRDPAADAARNEVVEANMGLVGWLVKRFPDRAYDHDDLAQDGALGLIRAVEKFDPGRGVQFSYYAQFWIRRNINGGLGDRGATVRLPYHVRSFARRYRERLEAMTKAAGGVPPDDDAVLDALAVPPGGGMREIGRDVARATRTLVTEIGQGWLDDNPEPAGGERGAAEAEAADEVARLLSILDGRSRAVVSLHWGLGGGSPMTFDEIARRLGSSRPNVGKRYSRAMLAIRLRFAPDAGRGSPTHHLNPDTQESHA